MRILMSSKVTDILDILNVPSLLHSVTSIESCLFVWSFSQSFGQFAFNYFVVQLAHAKSKMLRVLCKCIWLYINANMFHIQGVRCYGVKCIFLHCRSLLQKYKLSLTIFSCKNLHCTFHMQYLHANIFICLYYACITLQYANHLLYEIFYHWASLSLPYSTILYSTILYRPVLYSLVLCTTVQYYSLIANS